MASPFERIKNLSYSSAAPAPKARATAKTSRCPWSGNAIQISTLAVPTSSTRPPVPVRPVRARPDCDTRAVQDSRKRSSGGGRPKDGGTKGDTGASSAPWKQQRRRPPVPPPTKRQVDPRAKAMARAVADQTSAIVALSKVRGEVESLERMLRNARQRSERAVEDLKRADEWVMELRAGDGAVAPGMADSSASPEAAPSQQRSERAVDELKRADDQVVESRAGDKTVAPGMVDSSASSEAASSQETSSDPNDAGQTNNPVEAVLPPSVEVTPAQRARLPEFNPAQWERNGVSREWMEKYEQFLGFKVEHGRRDVYTSDPNLGRWVRQQREDYKDYVASKKMVDGQPGGRRTVDGMSPQKIELLKEAGFIFSKRAANPWMDKFAELQRFKVEHGHVNVGLGEKGNLSQLSIWANLQRQEYRRYQEGKPSTINAERIRLLQTVGFVWDCHNARWNERFQQLVEYKKEFGDTLVPKKYPRLPQLGLWCQRQRKIYFQLQKGTKKVPNRNLAQDRIKMLEALGFEWDTTGIRRKRAERGQASVPKVSDI